MKNIIIVRAHAVFRYAERVLRKPIPIGSQYGGITVMIRREIAEATPLSPMQRAIFADPRRGMSPNDEYCIHGSTVFVLTQPPRGGRRTCMTVIVATPAQLETIAEIAAWEEEVQVKKTTSGREHQYALGVHRANNGGDTIRLFLEIFAARFGTTALEHEYFRNVFKRARHLIRQLKCPQVPSFLRSAGDEHTIHVFWAHWQSVLDDANLR